MRVKSPINNDMSQIESRFNMCVTFWINNNMSQIEPRCNMCLTC